MTNIDLRVICLLTFQVYDSKQNNDKNLRPWSIEVITANAPLKPNRSMLILGYLGLIPFIVPSIIIAFSLFELDHLALSILKPYSFGIIAFMCGSIWPRNENDTDNRKSLISNALFLIAFFSFVFLSKHWLGIGASILFALYVIESHTRLTDQINVAYKRLRLHLTIGASTSLMLAQSTLQSL